VVYVSDTQAAVVAPFEIADKSQTKVAIGIGGQSSTPLTQTVSAASPAVFTADASGSGLAAAENIAADGSVTLNSTGNPAAQGGIVTVFATGFGTTTPLLVNGSVASILGWEGDSGAGRGYG